MKWGALFISFFSDSEKALLLLLKAQLALGSRWVSKVDASKALSAYGLKFDEAVERMGYVVSVGYKGSYIMLTTKGKSVRLETRAKQ